MERCRTASTTYAKSTSLRFYITGFSEYYNHSLSGVWHSYAPEYGHDHGLPDGTYSLQVFVRGYELTSSPTSITILGGGNQTVTLLMTRGGAFQVTVGSSDNRFGTRAVQARLPWRFLNSSIPVSARVYFYAGGTVGYVDRVMQVGVPNGVSTFTFTVLFAGQNWSLREIWFYGLFPTHITNNTYTISAYTLGYVSQIQGGTGISLQNDLVGFAQGFLTLFYANEVDITVPVFNTLQTLNSITEYDHVIGQVFSGGLSGAEMSNLSADKKPVPTLQLNLFGFGAMQLSNLTECRTNVFLSGNMSLCGQGHFFYVDPTGTRYFDYGLDIGNYTAALPEFGFLAHYFQVLALPAANFNDLFLAVGVFLKVIQMGRLYVTNSGVQGWTFGVVNPTSPLSWAQVQALNSTYSRSISTADGNYGGVGTLFLPGGIYNVTFSDQQYQSQIIVGFQVGWGSSYSVATPPLCPIGSTC